MKVIATGRCLPAREVTNDMLSRQVDTSDEWVFSRTGIHARRFCTEESGVDLAEQAARRAMEQKKIAPEEISVCLVATFSPDYATPSTACLLQKRLGLGENTICFDLNAACAGFLYGLKTADSLLADRKGYGLVIGCEVISRVLDMEDRNTCVLFGDGAGAAIIARDASPFPTVFGTRSDLCIWVQGPGPERAKVHMDGKAVFRFAVDIVEKSIRQLLEQQQLDIDDVDVVLCHQANSRIIDYVQRKLAPKRCRFFKNIEHLGNTSAASIPLALDEMREAGLLKDGMRIITVGFGAGLTWAGAMFEW